MTISPIRAVTMLTAASAATQAALEQAGLIDGMTMWSTNAAFSSLLLAGVGLYQISEMKARALARCRAETGLREPGVSGFHHAARCMTSSVPLMSLLFVGGVMNLYWIVALSAINLTERSLTSPRLFSKVVGIACILAALCMVGFELGLISGGGTRRPGRAGRRYRVPTCRISAHPVSEHARFLPRWRRPVSGGECCLTLSGGKWEHHS